MEKSYVLNAQTFHKTTQKMVWMKKMVAPHVLDTNAITFSWSKYSKLTSNWRPPEK